MFLLDTDTCIHFMKGNPDVVRHFRNHGPSKLFLSSISHHELLYGALHSAAVERHLNAVEHLTAPITILPFTSISATHSAKVRQQLAASGKTIGPLDTLIAGHALEHELILVTGNAREFSRVEGLKVETWG
jgi:tRNA(fMet)-specific endonuclease VapC